MGQGLLGRDSTSAKARSPTKVRVVSIVAATRAKIRPKSLWLTFKQLYFSVNPVLVAFVN